MVHIHLPDAAFSIQFLIFWWILAAMLITIALLFARWQTITARRLRVAAIVAAVSFVICQADARAVYHLKLADYNAHTARLRQYED